MFRTGPRCWPQNSRGFPLDTAGPLPPPLLTWYSRVSSILMLNTRPAANGRRNMKARLEPFSRSRCKKGGSSGGRGSRGGAEEGVCAVCVRLGLCVCTGGISPDSGLESGRNDLGF